MGTTEASHGTARQASAPAWPVRVYRRFASLLHEMGKFVGVGAVAYVVDTGLFNFAVYGSGWNAYNAKIMAMVVGATVAFIGNRYWTWRHRARTSLHREYLMYFGFNTVGIGITLGCVWIYYRTVDLWPTVMDNPIALNMVVNVFGVGLASLFRFYAYRTWVFVDRPTPKSDD